MRTPMMVFLQQLVVQGTKSGMEQGTTGEYPTPEVPMCYSWSHAKLQGAHAHYKYDINW